MWKFSKKWSAGKINNKKVQSGEQGAKPKEVKHQALIALHLFRAPSILFKMLVPIQASIDLLHAVWFLIEQMQSGAFFISVTHNHLNEFENFDARMRWNWVARPEKKCLEIARIGFQWAREHRWQCGIVDGNKKWKKTKDQSNFEIPRLIKDHSQNNFKISWIFQAIFS